MATPSNKELERLMAGSHTSDAGTYGTGAGEPMHLEVIADSTDAQVGSFYEPFWDLEVYDAKGRLVGIDGADYAANPWDCVQLGEHKLPGIWTANATPAIKLDIQRPLNADGAALISRGYLPAGITLTGLLWTPKQFRLLQDLWPAIWRKPFKAFAQDAPGAKKSQVKATEKEQTEVVGEQRALGVVNPALNMIGIFALVVQKPTPLVASEIVGVRRMTIECVEYVPEPAIKPSVTKRTKGTKAAERGLNAFDDAIKARDARAPKAPSTRAAALEPGKAP